MKNVKKKIDNIIKNYSVTFFYVVANFINTILIKVFTTKCFSIRAMFFNLFFILILTGISLFIGNKGRNRFYIITTFLMVAICVANSLYYNYYKSFVSISLLATSVFVKDVGDAVIDVVIRFCDLLYFWALIGIIIVCKRYVNKKKVNNNEIKKVFLIAIIALIMGSSLPPYNSFSRLYKLWNRVSVVNNFGPYVYQVDDIIQSLKPRFNNIFGYDRALRTTKEYYDHNKVLSRSNEYTNIFEGKNVIAIHAESLQGFLLDMEFEGKEVTPNINKLKNNSLYFSNFYAQIGVGTSSDSEFTYATGLLPCNNGTVFVNYYNNKYITIQNLLKNKGYYVFSMHGNVGDFWNREQMHINMGYDKFYSKSSFEIDEEYGLGLSDESFFRQVVPMIKDINDNIGKPYYGTLITLTNHTPWRDADKYSEFKTTKTVLVDGHMVTRDYLEDTLMGRYIKSANYMDKQIGNFIERMDQEGLLDNTVIVIYGDHDSRISREQYERMYNYDAVHDTMLTINDKGYFNFNEYEYELNRRVPLIIWTKDNKINKVVDTPMGMYDVLPTLGNMLGVYSDYALGQDIMGIKKEDGLVVFKDASYITDKVYYNAKNGEVYALSNGIIPDDYIKKNSEIADKMIEISNNIINYNLLKDLN